MYFLTSTLGKLMRRVMPSSILGTQPESFLFKMTQGHTSETAFWKGKLQNPHLNTELVLQTEIVFGKEDLVYS